MRALFLTIGPEAEPSSRFRAYQFVEPLRRHGIVASVRPRVGQRYFELGYGLRRAAAPIRVAWVAGSFACRTLRRVRDLWQARRFDVVIVQKETFPFGMERLISRLGVCAVYDFDDAIYEVPKGRDGLGRGIRRVAERLARRDRALPALLSRCRVVIAGSPVLAAYARDHNARVVELPTAVDTDAYPLHPVRRSGRLTIGWIGAPASAVYLEPLRPVFQTLARRFDVRVLLLGPSSFECPGAPIELRGWRSYASRAEEAAHLGEFDIGIMPLPDDRYAAGKCALKAIQYMACGIPVVASPVGANTEVVADGVCGFLAKTQEEWVDRLAVLLADPELRAAMGRAGRARAEERYSIRATLPQLARVLRSAAGDPQPISADLT
jgi:glycosyltransferase involved in cell wall biosynthesis